MTSIEQRDVQAVLAGIDDLLPVLRERAQLTEDLISHIHLENNVLFPRFEAAGGCGGACSCA